MAVKILNLGCGNDRYGIHRIDFFKNEATTEVADLSGRLPYKRKLFYFLKHAFIS